MSFWSKLSGVFKKVGKWTATGVSFLPYIMQATTIVEMISSAKGSDKKAQALELVKFFLSTSEEVAGHDLLNDDEVVNAAGSVIDAIVALQNIVAKKS